MKTIFIVLGVLAVIIIAIVILKSTSSVKSPFFMSLFPNNSASFSSKGTADFHGHTIKLLVAKTPKEQHIGLSDRNSLPLDTGMIFPFDHPDYYQFWMRHMKFPLDIIYVNGEKIVTVLENVQNPPYSMENPPILRPQIPADKILEVNAGTAKKYNVKSGDTIKVTL